MERYIVSGMSCAACQSRVEKAVRAVHGVVKCEVSLLTNSMKVEGSAEESKIIKAVSDAGYGAKLMSESSTQHAERVGQGTYAAEEEALQNSETPRLKKQFFTSLGFLLVLMYFSMGHMLLKWPLPPFFDNNHVAMGLAQLLLCAIIMVICQKFFISGFKALFRLAPNMDSLIALGSMAGFVYSVVILFLMTRSVVQGDEVLTKSYMMEFYFESSAMILSLITLGKMLESYSKGKTTNALKALMKLAPKTATVISDGKESEVGIEDVNVGDIFVVRSGENIPVDGFVLEGTAAVNEAALTGESIPVDKKEGDTVKSATTNLSGFMKCRATRVGKDTTLSQIIQMVSDASTSKAPIAALADTISGIFVPAVIALSVVIFAVWMIAGSSIGFALSRAITVLVVSCPCALGLATPVAIMVGNGVGAKKGILFKSAESLQESGSVKIVALDKTGTITKGEPVVTDIIPLGAASENEVLRLAVSLEAKSEHPLAKAIVACASAKQIEVVETQDFTAVAGNGISAAVAGKKYFAGNRNYIEENLKAALGAEVREKIDALAESGKTPVLLADETEVLGIIALADTIKDDSAKAISELKHMGLHVVMLTGDNEKTANAIAKEAGVDRVIAGVLPEGKDQVIQSLKKEGKVAMVGDGINDAPALTRADIGLAIGAGSDVALDAADVVLMKNSLADVSSTIRLSRRTLRNIKQNLFWALIYNTLLIPAAAGAYIHLFGITMNPMFGAAAMSLSSFCVVMNSLRLNVESRK